MHINPVFHISLLRPVVRGLLDKGTSEPSLPGAVEIEGTPVFKVTRLLVLRRRGGSLQYLVDWEGYSPTCTTTVPGNKIWFLGLLSRHFVSP